MEVNKCQDCQWYYEEELMHCFPGGELPPSDPVPYTEHSCRKGYKVLDYACPDYVNGRGDA